jgi:hypothetical protein
MISDGLGFNDREFTVPTALPIPVLDFSSYPSDGRYVIHAGDGYDGMFTKTEDQKTLIHELTHVWQGEHDTGAYWAFSLMAQAQSANAYAYDHDKLNDDWDSYGMEQQAQIVEDWYGDGMKPYDPDTRKGDLRFYFIKTKIRGESVGYDWLAPRVETLPAATLPTVWPAEATAKLNADLIPLLKQRFTATDVAGSGRRGKQVEEIFNNLNSTQAKILRERLEARAAGDELARFFYANLTPETIGRLMGILKVKWPFSKLRTTR